MWKWLVENKDLLYYTCFSFWERVGLKLCGAVWQKIWFGKKLHFLRSAFKTDCLFGWSWTSHSENILWIYVHVLQCRFDFSM